MLDTKDVAEMFKRCNLAVYAEARRIYYREVNLNVFVFFVSLCFQGFQRLAFCAYTLLTLYFLVLIQLYTRKRPARQAERLM